MCVLSSASCVCQQSTLNNYVAYEREPTPLSDTQPCELVTRCRKLKAIADEIDDMGNPCKIFKINSLKFVQNHDPADVGRTCGMVSMSHLTGVKWSFMFQYQNLSRVFGTSKTQEWSGTFHPVGSWNLELDSRIENVSCYVTSIIVVIVNRSRDFSFISFSFDVGCVHDDRRPDDDWYLMSDAFDDDV